MILAIAFVAVLALLALFQIALALGAPWGRFAWGGQHPGVLPRGYRIASIVSVLIYALLALIVLDLVGVIDVAPNGNTQIAAWAVFGYLVIGVIMNAISRSKPERNVMTPVALVLAVLAFFIALAGPPQQTFEGMVLDTGDGPVFCTVIMESYPPQCGDRSPSVAGWDWDAVAHDQQDAVRWGTYRLEGVLDAGTLTVSSVDS